MQGKLFVLCLLLLTCGVAYAQVIDTVCTGFSNAVYTVDSNMGSSYHWEITGGVITKGNGTHAIKVTWGMEPGIGRLTVIEKNASGCIGETQHAQVLLRGPQFNTSFPDQACLNDSVVIKATGGVKYLWSNGATDSIISIKLVTDTLLRVTISDTACGLRSDSFDVQIKAATKPVISITSDATHVYMNKPVNFFYHGNSTDRVNWQIDKPNISNPVGNGINIIFNDTGEAFIKVISVNRLGCTDSMTTRMEIHRDQVYFPTAFTPNGDGLNDVFKPAGLDVKQFRLTIFNRWGQAIFVSHDPDTGWDGTMDGTPVQTDVYTYQCDMTGPSGKVYGYSGNVTIIR